MRAKKLAGLAITIIASAWAGLAPLPALASATYTGGWMGSTYALTLAPNATVEGFPDAFRVGAITNFQSTNPTYSCLNGRTINVFLAPHEFPGTYVVHDGLQGPMCVYGTWTFSARYTYTGIWSGVTYSLTAVPNLTVESLPDASLISNYTTGAPMRITNFQTSDPAYQCLGGKSINVFMAQTEFPNQHVVHDGWQGSMCTYGTWLFMPVSHYQIAIQSWIPQAQTWDPDTSTICSLISPIAALLATSNYCPYPYYLAESVLGPVPNCYTPLFPINTLVYGLFTGDNHNAYPGTHRTQTVINFDWNPTSRTISNYTTSMHHGPSTVTLQYWYAIAGFPAFLLNQCSLSSDSGLQAPPSSATSTSFNTGTSGFDPFVPGAAGLGAVIDGSLWGTFNPNGTLSLNWKTDAFPSLGVQVWPNQGYDNYQLRQIANDASSWNTMDFGGITNIGLALNAYNALNSNCSYPSLQDPVYPCAIGATTLNPAP